MAWFPAGVILEKWEEEFYPVVEKIINDPGNYEKVFGRHNTGAIRPCRLYMVGDDQDWSKARPGIVTICTKSKIAQKIRDLLRDHPSIYEMNLGFDFLYHEQMLRLVAGDDLENASRTHCTSVLGQPVLTSTWPLSKSSRQRQATIGGAVSINGLYYGLMAAHAFDIWNSMEDLDRSNPSSESGYISDESETSRHDENQPPPFPASGYHADSFAASSLGVNVAARGCLWPGQVSNPAGSAELVGTLPPGSFEPVGTWERTQHLSETFCPERDWAFVEIECSQFHNPNEIRTPAGRILSPRSIASSPPNGPVLVAAGRSGVFESRCYGIIGGIILPGGTEMVDALTIESACSKSRPNALPGTC